MRPLEPLSKIHAEGWVALRRRALAAGCGRVLDDDAERVAAAHELLALALPELMQLGVVALLAEGESPPPRDCAAALSATAAAVLRLLDRVLFAHARDTGYVAAAWVAQALECAHARAGLVATVPGERLPLGMLVDDVAEAAADVVIALHADRLGVPAALADALASLLVLYAAGIAMTG